MNNVYFAGRSLGGFMASVCGWGYDLPFFGTNFSSQMNVRGIIPFYSSFGTIEVGSAPPTNEIFSGIVEGVAPEMRGSSNPDDLDFFVVSYLMFYFNISSSCLSSSSSSFSRNCSAACNATS